MTLFDCMTQYSKEHGPLFSSFIELNKYKTIVEVGVAYGTTSLFICKSAKINGCREFMLDLRTKFNDGSFDIFEIPYGNGKRRVGISCLVKRTFPFVGISIDEVCGSPSNPQEIIQKEREWYNS